MTRSPPWKPSSANGPPDLKLCADYLQLCTDATRRSRASPDTEVWYRIRSEAPRMKNYILAALLVLLFAAARIHAQAAVQAAPQQAPAAAQPGASAADQAAPAANAAQRRQIQQELQSLFREKWAEIRTGRCDRRKQVGSGTHHRLKDRAAFSHLLASGWDTPTSALEGYAAEAQMSGRFWQRYCAEVGCWRR